MKAEILDVIARGGSRSDAAKLAGIAVSTIQNEGTRDAKFLEGLTRAEADCKMRHLRVLNDSGDWRASAWLLSRKWPDEQRQRPNQTQGSYFVEWPLPIVFRPASKRNRPRPSLENVADTVVSYSSQTKGSTVFIGRDDAVSLRRRCLFFVWRNPLANELLKGFGCYVALRSIFSQGHQLQRLH